MAVLTSLSIFSRLLPCLPCLLFPLELKFEMGFPRHACYCSSHHLVLSRSGPARADQAPSGSEDTKQTEDPQLGRGRKDPKGDPEP